MWRNTNVDDDGQQIRAGKWRILAVATGERMKSSPDIPSIAEYGYDINLVGWWAAMVPMDTPRPIVDQLGVWFKQVVNSEAGQKFIAGIAADPWTSTPDEGQAFFRDEIEKWGDYVRIAKIEKQ